MNMKLNHMKKFRQALLKVFLVHQVLLVIMTELLKGDFLAFVPFPQSLLAWID